MVMDFISQTGANPNDALSCLKTWGWDLKKALIDYNGILYKIQYFFFMFYKNLLSQTHQPMNILMEDQI